MPYLQSSISPAIKLAVVSDRTITVRAWVKDIETTLLISIVLVILVVFVFLRTARATVIPSIAVPSRWWAPSAACICSATVWTIFL